MADKRVRPLPGSGVSPTGPMQKFLVLFREPETNASERSEFLAQRSLQTGMMIEKVRSIVHTEGLEAELETVGEATSFGLVSIIGTELLAERLRKVPEIEAVVAD